MTRKLKKGGYAAILSVIVIAAVVLLNMIVGRLPEKVRRWDLSGTQIYTCLLYTSSHADVAGSGGDEPWNGDFHEWAVHLK